MIPNIFLTPHYLLMRFPLFSNYSLTIDPKFIAIWFSALFYTLSVYVNTVLEREGCMSIEMHDTNVAEL